MIFIPVNLHHITCDVFQATLQQQLDTAQVEHQQALKLKDIRIKRLEHQLTAQVC